MAPIASIAETRVASQDNVADEVKKVSRRKKLPFSASEVAAYKRQLKIKDENIK